MISFGLLVLLASSPFNFLYLGICHFRFAVIVKFKDLVASDSNKVRRINLGQLKRKLKNPLAKLVFCFLVFSLLLACV